jgi:hypothetical protein
MDAKTKAVKAHRARLKRRGMKRLEVWVPASETAVIRKAASVLREHARETARLRQLLGFGAEPGRKASALDLFAMPEPLSAKSEAAWDDVMEQIQSDRKKPAHSRARKLAL